MTLEQMSNVAEAEFPLCRGPCVQLLCLWVGCVLHLFNMPDYEVYEKCRKQRCETELYS